jgi:hypothetical protein
MEDKYTKLRYLTHARLGYVWKLGLAGAELEGEDAVTVEVLKQHPEYFDLWEQAELLPPDEEVLRDGVNPFLHVTIHATVENQIANGDPPQTAETLEAMIQAGYDRHEAIHAIGSLIAEQIFEIMAHDQPFDLESYVEALRELAQAKPSRSRRRRRSRRPRRKHIH